MMTRSLPFGARRPSAALVPFRPAATAIEAGRSAPSRRRPSARNRPALERMEERTLLSAVSVPTYASYVALTGQTPLVSLAPMQNTVIQQTPISALSRTKPQFQVDLQAGETISLSLLDKAPGYHLYSLTVTDPAGAPVSSGLTQEQSDTWCFTAPATGTYTVADSDGIFGPTDSEIQATVRPIELIDHTVAPAASADDAALVSYDGGGLYAWLNPGHSALTLSGPTGIGFQVGGQWSEVMSPTTQGAGYTSTYTATGRLSLRLGGSQLTLPLPSGTAFTVTTLADGADGLFGQVTGAGFDLGWNGLKPLLGFINNLPSASILNFPGSVASLPQVNVGIDLGGSQGVRSTNLPADPAIPYLYFSLNTGASLSFGNIHVLSADSQSVGVAIDPADPSIGVDVQGIPVLNEVALEVSQGATIPFAPQATPARWNGTLYGDIYVKGTFDLAALTGDSLPMAVSSGITVNLDPNHQGLTRAVSTEFGQFLGGQMTASAALQYLDGLTVGINGEVDLTLPAGSLASIVLPAAEASMIYDGPARTLYLHADTMNPFANTPIASFLPNSSSSFDGTIDFANGQFQFTADERFTFAGLAEDAQLTLSNGGVDLVFDTTLSDSVSVGSLSASVSGSLTDNLLIEFDSSSDVSFELGVMGQATASWNDHSWSSGSLIYWWGGNADLSDLESQTASDVQSIKDDVAAGVTKWLKSLESSAGSIWHRIGDWFTDTF